MSSPAPTEWLKGIYRTSRERLKREIARRIQQGGYRAEVQKLLIKEIDDELKGLNARTQEWSEAIINRLYKKGAFSALRTAHRMGEFVGFMGTQRAKMEILANNTTAFISYTNGTIARQAEDRVRRLGIEIIAEKNAEMLTVREAKKRFEQRLLDEDFLSVPWRNGRGAMRIDSYAELVSRTTQAEVVTTATLDVGDMLGEYLYYIDTTHTTCAVCSARQGRVYRVKDYPEGDERNKFPHIKEGLPRYPEYKTIHPNCTHTLSLFIWGEKTKRERREALSNADKPFNLDTRGEDERKRYEAIQRANIERMRDRKQWERYRAVLGKDNVPKTLSAFRAIKKADGKKWELLRGYYLGVKKADISALTGFEHYAKTAEVVEKELVGVYTKDGVKVTGYKPHFIDRIVGSYHIKREGVSIKNVKETLQNADTIKEHKTPIGDLSRHYHNEKCGVTINPTTGILIQTNPVKGALK